MSTESKPYWTIACDVCKNRHGHDSYEFTVFDSEVDAMDAARDSDWRIFPDMHVCCWCIDKGVVPDGAHAEDPDDKEYCRWCGDEWPHEVAEHQHDYDDAYLCRICGHDKTEMGG